MENLTTDQRRAVGQLQGLTDGHDEDLAAILDSVGWDVPKAAELIFGAPVSTSSHNEIERFELDDSRQGRVEEGHGRRRLLSWAWLLPSRPSSVLSFLAFPFHIITSLFRFIFGILRIPIPQLRFASLHFYRSLRHGSMNPRGGADRWVRELEEETGAICIGRAPQGVAASGSDAGPSTLSSRPVISAISNEENRKLLPDFTLGSYEEALRTCEREAKIGCVILVSEEHDDVAEFKRTTLTDADFVKLLYENGILVWGGDVKDQEAWSAAQKLQATSYPFVAFLALQPRRSPITTSSRSSSAPTLTVLSRHQGRSVPSTAPTSAETLIEHLQRQLIPRIVPFLDRIRNSHRERDLDRLLREGQDRAFQDSARRDRERMEAKMAMERQEAEERKMREEEIRVAEERRVREIEECRKREVVRMNWRRWARRTMVLPDLKDSKQSLRIAVRFPRDGRVIHSFSHTATLTTLYVFVDNYLIPRELDPADDPHTSPGGQASGEEGIEHAVVSRGRPDEWWGFRLVLAYPRREIKWEPGVKLCDVEHLKGGGQVVVEMVGVSTQEDADDDGDSD